MKLLNLIKKYQQTIPFNIISYLVSYIIIHWLLIRIYVNYCSINSFYGLIYNMITLGSPLCQTINYIQYTMSQQYIIIWTGYSSYIIINYLNHN